ncbi:MAG: hypothetical protein HRT47_11985 [Candidatus Caenarcaniphilales bacterium]|nr:hypothetical protein [Candidatus Caenarcaniphilales bacterium]
MVFISFFSSAEVNASNQKVKKPKFSKYISYPDKEPSWSSLYAIVYQAIWITPKLREQALAYFNYKVQKRIDKQKRKKKDPLDLELELLEEQYQKLSLKPWDKSDDLMLLVIPRMIISDLGSIHNPEEIKSVAIVNKQTRDIACKPKKVFKVEAFDFDYIDVLYNYSFSSVDRTFDVNYPAFGQTYDINCIAGKGEDIEILISHEKYKPAFGKVKYKEIRRELKNLR